MPHMLVVANWKASMAEAQAKAWLQQFSIFNFQFSSNFEVAIAPPYPLIPFLCSEFQISNFKFQICSQDVSMYPPGQYTGEVPAKMLADLKVKYCLVGHSERRKYLGETNAQVEAKMDQLIKNGIIPIICAQNLEEIPANIRNCPSDKYLIMYEPSSAISTQGEYHPENPDRIATILADWQKKLPRGIKFLYGGSVNPKFVYELLTTNHELLSGFVVGHASLDASTFFAIIDQCFQVQS